MQINIVSVESGVLMTMKAENVIKWSLIIVGGAAIVWALMAFINKRSTKSVNGLSALLSVNGNTTLENYCYQAALNGWTPSNCQGLYDYTSLAYPEFAPYIDQYWPTYYNSTYLPYYGTGGNYYTGGGNYTGGNYHRGGGNNWHNRGGNWNRGNDRRGGGGRRR